MIDERFSVASFEELIGDKVAIEERIKLLATEIQTEMFEQAIHPHFLKIIDKLNSMGHSLKLEEPPTREEISFRDDCEEEPGFDCKLRVCFFTVVPTGYKRFSDCSYLSEESPE